MAAQEQHIISATEEADSTTLICHGERHAAVSTPLSSRKMQDGTLGQIPLRHSGYRMSGLPTPMVNIRMFEETRSLMGIEVQGEHDPRGLNAAASTSKIQMRGACKKRSGSTCSPTKKKTQNTWKRDSTSTGASQKTKKIGGRDSGSDSTDASPSAEVDSGLSILADELRQAEREYELLKNNIIILRRY